MQLLKLEQKLNDLYDPGSFSDYCPLGLVVEGKSQIRKGATAVSFTGETVQKVIREKADFLVVHHIHGFWNNQPKIFTGGLMKKLSALIKHDMSLFAYHLPMDAQPKIGNNTEILRTLGAEYKECFNREGEHEIGIIGKLPKPLSLQAFHRLVKQKIGPANFSFSYGVSKIQTVAVCSGGGAGLVHKAKNAGADIYITGEAKEDTLGFCQDEKFNFIASGHYNTEVFGPKALAVHLTKNKIIPTVFVDVPNPV
ncbi:MAG: Nif3-like dinuclear metal center hexameric protein [Fibrobacteria bacterium]|nr:Nif3-like dinuclear metal center hexameric protein [Fibrobacteria bacterium]